MDYLDFYGLEQEPFSSAPISRFYFNSAQHQRALVRLMYAVDSMKGLAVLIGDLGTGKTTLARRMLDNLPEEEYESALLVIIHSGITADWLLSRIARQLGVEAPAPEKLKLLNQLYGRLVELHDKGKKAVVLIDEAQMLHSQEIMEEFRGLLNLELPESKLITFVFFGLPELEEHLHLDEPLAQRVALKCTLDSFNLESTYGYIAHRMRLAGSQGNPFEKESCRLIHHYSRGIPRIINTICDNSLFEGYLMKSKKIKSDLVQAIATDLGLAPIPKPAARAAKNAGKPAEVTRIPTRLPPPDHAPSIPVPPPAPPREDDFPDQETGERTAMVPPPPPPPVNIRERAVQAGPSEEPPAAAPDPGKTVVVGGDPAGDDGFSLGLPEGLSIEPVEETASDAADLAAVPNRMDEVELEAASSHALISLGGGPAPELESIEDDSSWAPPLPDEPPPTADPVTKPPIEEDNEDIDAMFDGLADPPSAPAPPPPPVRDDTEEFDAMFDDLTADPEEMETSEADNIESMLNRLDKK